MTGVKKFWKPLSLSICLVLVRMLRSTSSVQAALRGAAPLRFHGAHQHGSRALQRWSVPFLFRVSSRRQAQSSHGWDAASSCGPVTLFQPTPVLAEQVGGRSQRRGVCLRAQMDEIRGLLSSHPHSFSLLTPIPRLQIFAEKPWFGLDGMFRSRGK